MKVTTLGATREGVKLATNATSAFFAGCIVQAVDIQRQKAASDEFAKMATVVKAALQ